MNQFQSWQTVKVIDESLETHGKVGVVKSASEYAHDGKTLVDVQMDGDTELTVFEASQVAAV